MTYKVKTRFQNLPFKCNLHRYNEANALARYAAICQANGLVPIVVGRCRLTHSP
jgi:fructose-bisphosphate aldolase class 1